MAEEKRNVHAGHRNRMKKKFKATGGEGMPDHEIMELLLYYSIPRSNTNDVAHDLLDRFDSIEGIINAKPEHSMQVEGIGENSALLLALVGEVLRRVARGSIKKQKKYNSIQDMADYLQRMFVGMSQECVYLMMFDNGMRLIDTVELARGEVNHVLLDPHRLMKEALLHNASSVLIAHNHPDGEPLPSDADIKCTDSVRYLLSTTNITLIDHLVFSGRSYTSMLHSQEYESVDVVGDFYEAYYRRHGGSSEPTAE